MDLHMKKIWFMLPALMWLAFFPSCNKEIEPAIPEDEPVPDGCYFRAYPETPEGDTRTYLDGTDVIWRVGEELKVMNSAGTARNFESMDNARKALFYYEGSDFAMSHPYFAIYPSSGSISLTDGKPTFSYTVSATQSSSAGSFADGTNVAAGWAGEDKKLSMINLNSYVSFSIAKEDLIDNVVLSCTSGNLAGTVSQPFTGNTLSSSFGSKTVTGGSTSITMTPASGDYFTAGQTYYIAIIPGSFTGLQLDLKNGEKLVSRKTRSEELTASRNNIYALEDITPSDVASAFGKASTVKNVSGITKRTLETGLDYYYVQTTSRTSNEGVTPETTGTVNFHILEIQFSASPAFDMRCVLPYNAPTPWDKENWDTGSILNGGWVSAVNKGDEHVLAMFPCSDYRDSTEAGNNVPYGQVHSRGQILRSTSTGTNKDAVTVRRVGSVVRGLSFETGTYPYSTYYGAPENYSDLGGSFNRLIQDGVLQDYQDWQENNSGHHAAIGYVGDNTGGTNGNYKKTYYIISDGAYPYNLADLMKELGCSNAAMQHPGAMGELILENSGKNGYEVQGNASESVTAVMTAWALVLKQSFTPRFIAGSITSPGRVDGTGTSGAQLQRPHGICWSGTEGVAYFTQRITGTQAVRKINVATGEVTTLAYNDNASPGNKEMNGPYGCCEYTFGSDHGVLVANKNGSGRPWKMFFVDDDGDLQVIDDSGLPATGTMDVKVAPDGKVWTANLTNGLITKGSFRASTHTTTPQATYEYLIEQSFDVKTIDSGWGKYPCCLAFDADGNTIYGTWVSDNNEEGNYSDGRPGIYLIPAGATDNTGIVRIAGDASTIEGTDLGTPGNMLTATFPVVSGLYCGSDGALYIACGFNNGGAETTNAVRKLIPVNKGTLTADSYIKGRMISINDPSKATLAAAGIIVNDACTEAYVADFSHRICKITISH